MDDLALLLFVVPKFFVLKNFDLSKIEIHVLCCTLGTSARLIAWMEANMTDQQTTFGQLSLHPLRYFYQCFPEPRLSPLDSLFLVPGTFVGS